ncbi:MAG: cysteine synthase A [Omnitrophica bacterium]|nr:cysteine synthase A [Candidatus Omnitrophota bacterium]
MATALYLNGKKEEIEDNMLLSELLKLKKIRPEVVTVELNDKVIEKEKYTETHLAPDDRLEFVYYMGGGNTFSSGVAKNALELIGNTPMVKINRMTRPGMAEILAKVESYTPGGSIKDRICLAMIDDAEKKGLLSKGSTIIEPTSGNTGIGLAVISAVRGYRCILTMPETMSLERVFILKSYGAELVLTPGKDGMVGAIKKAEELLKKTPNSFMPQQFKNKANPEVHRRTTAQEIINATGGNCDAFVAGVGTGGTITGVGEVLKKRNPKIKVVAVEPATSSVLSGGKPGPHKIQGIGAGFVPEILNKGVIDEIMKANDNESFAVSRRLAREEGLFVGISSGAAMWAALKVAKDLGEGKRVVVILPDTGERYFSIEQYFEA